MSLSKRKPQKPVEWKVNVEGMFPVNIDSQGTLDFTQALIKYSLYTTLQTKPANILQNQVAVLSSLKLFLLFHEFSLDLPWFLLYSILRINPNLTLLLTLVNIR